MSDGFIIKRGGGGGDSNAAFKALVDRSITEVTADMLQGITTIGGYAFYYCASLTSIEIPNSVISIGDSAFYRCQSLTSVTIPNGVTSIYNAAFRYCSSLASVTVKATTPPSLWSAAFSDTPSSLVIYVPAESVDAYKAAWSNYADKIQAIPSD